jgi:hypothetical protein
MRPVRPLLLSLAVLAQVCAQEPKAMVSEFKIVNNSKAAYQISAFSFPRIANQSLTLDGTTATITINPKSEKTVKLSLSYTIPANILESWPVAGIEVTDSEQNYVRCVSGNPILMVEPTPTFRFDFNAIKYEVGVLTINNKTLAK